MYAQEITQNQTLADLTMVKAVATGDDGRWTFKGIASDESPDSVGDEMLKSIIDVSYAQNRGYVNWNHSQDPKDQVGYLSRIDVIEGDHVLQELAKSFDRALSPTACVYVEGELYKNVPQAQHIWNVMSSTPEEAPGLGLSLEGGLARLKTTGKLVKAIVRGIAITPRPAHPCTFMELRKSISDHEAEILAKTAEAGMDHDQAVLFMLKHRPAWNYDLASRFVQYTMQKNAKELQQ